MTAHSRKTIVVGASSGIGAALVEVIARRGEAVVAVARRTPELEALIARCKAANASASVTAITHDVTHHDDVRRAFDASVMVLGGRVDRVIYAAGVMPKVRIDEFDASKDRSMIEVNVIGAMSWLDLAASRFLEQRSGQIVGISSIAGERGRLGNPAYCASKACFSTFLESLRNRLTRHGVSVVTVKPGFIQTDMLKGVEKLFWVISAERCAQVILDGADRGRQSFFVPARWGLVAFVIRNIPSFIFRRLNV